MTDSTIPTDVHIEAAIAGLDGNDADGFEAFLANVSDDPKRKPGSTTETEGEAPETGDTEGQEPDTTEGEEPNANAAKDGEGEPDDVDDYEVEIKVGEETKTATIRDLKRLYGQEASLTQKSQKLAEETRTAAAQSQAAQVALRTLLDRAKARYEPFAGLDPLVLAKELDTETFAAFRKEEAAARADVDFLTQELSNAVRTEQARSQQAYAEAAKACVAALSDPEKGIKDWSQDLYNGLMAYADEHNLQGARSIVDPSALKLLHKAYLYDQGQKAAKQAAAKATKAVSKTARMLRPGAALNKGTRATQNLNEAMGSLRRTGSDDDAVMAFMAGLNRDD